jgi:hypothetical protein
VKRESPPFAIDLHTAWIGVKEGIEDSEGEILSPSFVSNVFFEIK